MLLTRDQILEQRLPQERVPVPWIEGGEVVVRAVPAHVMVRADNRDDPERPYDALVFVNVVVDEKGNRLYKDSEAKLVADTVDTALIRFVVAKAFHLAEIPEDRKEAIKKNWPTPDDEPSGESPSASGTRTPT